MAVLEKEYKEGEVIYFVLALDACEGCGKCIEICPSRYIEPRPD